MKATIIVTVIVLLTYSGMSIYWATTAMKIPRIPLEDSPASVGLAYEDVSFPSRVDRVTLKGWYIPGGESCIIIVNGGHQNRVDPVIGTLELTRDLVDKGYSVLLFDLRGRGESEGKGLTLTHGDRDIVGAVDYAKSRVHTVYIIGFSTGAADSILLPDGITAMVLDSCFANVHEMSVRGAVEKGYPKPLVKIFSPGVFLMARTIYGYQVVDPEDRIGDVTCPIFLIHGEEDSIPPDDAYRLYDALDNPSDQLWVVRGADHCLAYKTNPVGYIDKVTTFLSFCGESRN